MFITIKNNIWFTSLLLGMIVEVTLTAPAQAVVAKFLASFKQFPPRMKPASFSVGDALSHIQAASQGR